MPSIDGKLTEQEKAEAISRLNAFDSKRGGDLVCEVCGTDTWYLNDYLVQVPSDTPKGPLASRMRTPLVALYCGECGNMKFFASESLGVKALRADEATGGAPNGD